MEARPSFDAPEELLAQSEWLARLARSLVSSSHDAADLAQDTLAAALEHPPKPGMPMRPWLARIAHNLAIRRRIGGTRRDAREERAARPEGVPAAADVVERVAMQRTVVEAVLALDEPYRSTLLLRYWDDLAPREIAGRLAVPVETVRTRLKRAIVQLRERLDCRHGGRETWMSALLPIAIASRPAAATSATTAGLGSIGALLMSTPMKIALAAAAVLLAALVVQRATDPRFATGIATATAADDLAPLANVDAANAPPSDPAEALDDRNEVAAASKSPAPWNGAEPDIVCTVLDGGTRSPIAGAHVELRQSKDFVVSSLVRADTDASGVARLADPRETVERRRSSAGVSVLADGYAWALVAIPHTPQTESTRGPLQIEALLVRETVVRGRVVASDGSTPIAGASLRVTRDPALSLEYELAGAPEIGVSDARGAFTLDQRIAPRILEPTILFAVAAQGVGWTTLGLAKDLDELRDVQVRVRPSAELGVTVRDAQGAPIEGADVRAYPRFEPLGEPYVADLPVLGGDERVLALFRTRSDKAGLASLPKLPVDDDPTRATHGLRYTITVGAPGHREVKREVTLDIARRTDVELFLEARESFAMRGTISGSAGPIANARVRTRGLADKPSDAAGLYRIECEVPQTRKLSFQFDAPGYVKRELTVQVEPGETERVLDVDLSVGARLEGTVVDEAGRPLAGFRPQLEWARRDARSAEPQLTGDDGKFVFEGLEPKRWHLTLLPPHDGPEFDGPSELVIEPSESPLTVRLQRREPGRVTLTVDIVDAATQQPIAASEASLREEQRLQRVSFRHPIERALGRLTATRLSRGRWILQIAAANGARVERALAIDQDDGEIALRIELGSPGRIVGRVVFDDVPPEQRPDFAFLLVDPNHEGQWIPGADQRPEHVTRGYAPLHAGEGFAFRFEDVRALDRVVLMLGPAPYYGRVEVTVPPAGEAQVEVHAKLGGELVFVREGELKTSTTSLTLRCEGESEPREDMLLLDDERLDIRGFTVPAGRVRWTIRYRTSATREQPSVIEGEAQIAPGATVRAPIRF